MDTISTIVTLIEKIALNNALGPIIILASLYYIYDGYKKASSVQMSFAGIALIWSIFTVYVTILH